MIILPAMTSGLKLRKSLLLVAGLLLCSMAGAQEVQHLTVRQKGGMPGLPILSGIQVEGTNVTVTWDGPAGYHQLVKNSGLLDASWVPAAPPNLDRVASVPIEHSNLFFRVIGPAPNYAGDQACAACHPDAHAEEMNTRHAGALETLRAAGEQNNPSCLPCHTVGFGLPTGFISEDVTPHLGGVQCESCHGPAGNHAANENDPTVRPRVELAATVCGGCHEAESHRPHFEDWSGSGHGTVTRENMNATSCGRCHIGSARIALLKDEPVPQNDRNLPITCVVCHDPHGRHVFTNSVSGLAYTNQVRNPLHSSHDYFLTTEEVFTNKYDPSIHMCAQCHNHRGADWTSTGGPPHHSPQYNMLLGTVGEIPPGVAARNNLVHAGLQFTTGQSGEQVLVSKQCVTCHMQTEEHSADMLAVTGHKFSFESYSACAQCHAFPEALGEFASMVISNRIQSIKADLDLWGATKADPQLRAEAGVIPWEYTRTGDLSPGGSGPSTALQALIPDNIKKARFNLYLVLYDGSYGIHNTPHAITLLNAAQTWVNEALKE